MATTRMSLKLFMDKEKKTVKFAECGNDFVDVLLSFLTMPIGTIIRLTDKESKIGGMSTLYESVGRLDVSLLQTEACRKMLLHPKNASEEHCKNLKVNIDDTEPTKYYKCSCDCCAKNCGLVSTVYNAQCGCGQSMKTQKADRVASSKDGVFVKRNMKFIVRDYLQVSLSDSMKEKQGSSTSVPEVKIVDVGEKEVLHLLKRSLLSKTPLTDVLLPLDGKDIARPQKEIASPSKAQRGPVIRN
eukprot:TRINITY_DN7159_c2_g1_i7.p1 TRINITY_DN7159_c2_g1~~TRINITY_DN7159_c2_g1_i7.p1  ORF type:complete len:243 (-),score=29.60 TRINITY_DN7159_c2_g1_i7:167-895(-)